MLGFSKSGHDLVDVLVCKPGSNLQFPERADGALKVCLGRDDLGVGSVEVTRSLWDRSLAQSCDPQLKRLDPVEAFNEWPRVHCLQPFPYLGKAI